eukprot:scaffold103637_cov21-Phaeocystis_antarctica.AAC.1
MPSRLSGSPAHLPRPATWLGVGFGVGVGVGSGVGVGVGVVPMLRLRLRAHQLEHGQPVADLAAVLLEELARQLEDVALRWSGFGVGAE